MPRPAVDVERSMRIKGTARRPRRLGLRELRARLTEAEQTLKAIQGGEVDAFVVYTRHGDQVFTLQGAEHPYRVLVEQMEEGAATVSADGSILYANRRLAAMLRSARERLVGASIYAHISPADQPAVRALLGQGRTAAQRTEATLCAADGTSVPVALAANPVWTEDVVAVCLILTDLTTGGGKSLLDGGIMLGRRFIDEIMEGPVLPALSLQVFLIQGVKDVRLGEKITAWLANRPPTRQFGNHEPAILQLIQGVAQQLVVVLEVLDFLFGV